MAVARPWAWPLVIPYWAGLRIKDGLRAVGVLAVRRLDRPVISVGSVSAGGAGKTPVVIALADLLTKSGCNVDVLSRGYRREGLQPQQVQPGVPDAARRFGDEPVLIASRTGVPVWVGADRFEAGTLAEAAGGGKTTLHLLDDGFQHRRLARAMDVVLLTAADLDDALLPAGNRREPLSSLRRADVLVLREDEADLLMPRARQSLNAGAETWTVRRSLKLSHQLATSGRPLFAFCGIARPDGFFRMLREQGVHLAGQIAFPDHHRYTAGDVSRVARSCHLEGCGFITTEKDAVKLGPELREVLESAGGLFVATLDTVFLDPERVMETLKRALG